MVVNRKGGAYMYWIVSRIVTLFKPNNCISFMGYESKLKVTMPYMDPQQPKTHSNSKFSIKLQISRNVIRNKTCVFVSASLDFSGKTWHLKNITPLTVTMTQWRRAVTYRELWHAWHVGKLEPMHEKPCSVIQLHSNKQTSQMENGPIEKVLHPYRLTLRVKTYHPKREGSSPNYHFQRLLLLV